MGFGGIKSHSAPTLNNKINEQSFLKLIKSCDGKGHN